MKLKLLDKLIMLSKLSLYGLVIQCLMLSSIWAEDISAQKVQSVSDVTVEMEFTKAKLEKVFKMLEHHTDFHFSYSKEDIDQSLDISFRKGESLKVRDILIDISKKSGLKFRQLNRNIIVQRGNSPNKYNNDVEVFIKNVDISGKITDENGEGLPGASVVEKGTTNGTTTNLKGEYNLTVVEGAVLTISFVGYEANEVVVGRQSVIDIQLKPSAEQLDEILVVGYGTQKKQSVTGSVAQVDSEELTRVPTSSVSKMLSGRLPGLVVKQGNGAPGTLPSLSIRGFNTANEGALIIVDGVQRDFQNLDPNEIESITILKDASAAVYGARAASGVILVTTKRGKMGKPVFTYNSTTSFQTPTGYAETIDAKTMLESPHFTRQPPISDARREGIINGTIPSTNFQEALTRKWSPLSQHNLNVRGGNDNALYFVSAGFTDQGSVFKTGDYGFKRYNITSNLDLKISENLSSSIDLGWRREVSEQSPRGGFGIVYNLMQIAHPALPVFHRDGSIATSGFGNNTSYVPTSEDAGGLFKSTRDVFNANFGLKYKIPGIKGLNAEGKFSMVSTNQFNKNFEKSYITYIDDGTNITEFATHLPNGSELTEITNRSQRLTTQIALRYENSFGDHGIKALALRETIDDENNSFSAFRDQLISPEVPYLFTGGADNQQATGSASEDGRKSYVGRINYSYKQKYYLEASFRADAVPRFPTETRWGFFPGVSAAWIISEELFLRESPVVSNLKLRLSVANLGNDNTGGAYEYLSGFSIVNNTNRWYYTGNTLQPAIQTLGVPNPSITWQEATTYNAGLDAGFLDGQLTTEFDVFYRKRTGLLASANSQIPNTVGAALPQTNINSRDNRGFETKLTYKGQISEFKYRISGNVSWNREKYLHYEEPEYTAEDDIRIRIRSGNWVNRQIGYVFNGFFNSQDEIDNDPINYTYNPRPGDIRYADVNGDGVLNGNDQTVIGRGGQPEWMGGLNVTMEWKGFDFTMFWQGAAGFNQQFNSHERSINPNGARGSYVYLHDNVWTEENKENARFPGRWGGPNNYNTDEYLVDSKYVRLKNLVIGYSLPKPLISKIGIESLRFFAAGTNLFTIDGLGIFGEFDPENAGFGGYPQQKVLTVGMNLSF